MKKNILFLARADKNWMGGIYYIKNQIMQLLSYKPARKQLNIFLYTSQKCRNEYLELQKYKNIKLIYEEDVAKRNLPQIYTAISKELDADIVYLTCRYNISYIFPYFPKGKINRFLLLKKSISWIPDFQHVHLPAFFSKGEVANRERDFGEIAVNHNKLVLSSHDSYKDYANKYRNYTKGVYVIPFCSVLDKSVVKQDDVEKTKLKYGIKGNYFIICNQFWIHKNHMLAFRALKQVLESEPEITLVCTGNLNDYRNKKYIHEVKEYICDNELQSNVFILGLVDKTDQIQLLKGAIALIQPSLFEGWGTCVEDAKTLNKRTLLSDIAIHHEQMDKNTRLFNPKEPDELAKLMLGLWIQEKDQVQKSDYSLKRAPEYGELFYSML